MSHSMTAFARKNNAAGDLFCEIRSVNHRYLEVSVSLPSWLRHCEHDLVKLIRESLARGKVECKFSSSASKAEELPLNKPYLENLIGQLIEVENIMGKRELPCERSSPLDILRYPGVIVKEAPEPSEQTTADVRKLCEVTLAALVAARKTEGATLQALIQSRCEQIGEINKELKKEVKNNIDNVRERIHERLSNLNYEVDDIRIEQEIVLLANKSDISEELDRLDSHLREIEKVFERKEAKGRVLDFIMQELNREATTVLAKARDIKITRKAVTIKSLAEQAREQVQNLE